MPNVLGRAYKAGLDSAYSSYQGLRLEKNAEGYGGGSEEQKKKNDLIFDASLSNSIFGKSSKVQPKGYQLLMIIKS